MIYQGDSLTILKKLGSESVDCCVTSPPYWGLRDYGVAGQLGLEKTPEEYVDKMVEVFREVRRVLKNDGTVWLNLGDSYNGGGRGGIGCKNASLKQFTNTGTLTMPKLIKALGLKPKDLVGIPWRVAFALQEDGWYLRQDIIWSKPNPMPESVRDRCTKAHEYIFLLSKSAKYFFDNDAIREPLAEASIERLSQPNLLNQKGSNRVPAKTNGSMKAVCKYIPKRGGINRPDYDQRKWIDRTDGSNGCRPPMTMKDRIYHPLGRNKRSVWTITTKPCKEAHFATFPPEIPEICIKAGCPQGGVVLDPFFGIGTTGIVAKKLGRDFIGIELNQKYIEIAERKIEKECGRLF